MAIDFRSSSTGDVHSPGSTLAITKPTGAASTDILLAIFGSGFGGSVGSWTPPAGWTAIGTTATSSNVSVCAFSAPGSASNLTFTKSGNVSDVGWTCLAFTGLDVATPVDATGSNATSSGSSTATAAAVTVVTDQAWLVIAAADWLGGNLTAPSFTRVQNASANESAACLYNPTPKSTGSTGTTTVTSSAASSGQFLAVKSFALRPASVAPATYPAALLIAG